MTFTCTKLSGTGNTFLFLDVRSPAQNQAVYTFFKTRSRSRITQILCDSYHSVGADGVVFVEKAVNKVNNFTRAHLQWDFYNADGSKAEMCGNASRCMAIYARHIGVRANPLLFSTGAGTIAVSSSKGPNYDVAMTQVSALALDQVLPVKKRSSAKNQNYSFVNSGVPHAVVEVKFSLQPKNLNDKNLATLANIDHMFKSHPRFKTKGTNVTFFKIVTPGHLESLTFERGVRGYTQACGTGAVAAAVIYRLNNFAGKKRMPPKIKLTLPGGTVWVDLTGPRPHLIGPAKEIAEITLSR